MILNSRKLVRTLWFLQAPFNNTALPNERTTFPAASPPGVSNVRARERRLATTTISGWGHRVTKRGPLSDWAVVSMRNRIGTVHGVREFRGEPWNKQKRIVRAQHIQPGAAGGRGSEATERARERKRAG